MKKKMNNEGFSLVELIIVIAIMAVLIGVLAPQYLKYVKNSKISTDITNAEEIANAVNAAIADGQTVMASPITGVGGTAVTGIDNLTALPVSKVDATYSWSITYNTTNGVTAITLGGSKIWPDATTNSAGYYKFDNK